MIEKYYILDKGTSTIFEAYIDPEKEWCEMKNNTEDYVKIFNDINPETGKRTGKYYHEDCIFSKVSVGRECLKIYIDNLIKRNRTKIGMLQDENMKLLEIQLSIK